MEPIRSMVAAMLCCLPLWVSAQELRFGSGDDSPVMIELYTSQGCNSCPPAEARLNAYVDDPRLWKQYIPLAFHVDYWDDLGWKDRFAAPAHSARQRAYAASGRLSTVYTPAFVVNGEEWRTRWFGGEPSARSTAVAGLQVDIVDGRVHARPVATGPESQPLVMNVAWLGMGLDTQITAGENRGRHSHHEFVVLGWWRSRAAATPWEAPLPPLPFAAAERYALVVWLNRPGDPAPLYAAGRYLPDQAAVPGRSGAQGR